MRSRLRWLGEQVGWLLEIAASLLLMLVLLPLVPLFEDVRRHPKGLRGQVTRKAAYRMIDGLLACYVGSD